MTQVDPVERPDRTHSPLEPGRSVPPGSALLETSFRNTPTGRRGQDVPEERFAQRTLRRNILAADRPVGRKREEPLREVLLAHQRTPSIAWGKFVSQTSRLPSQRQMPASPPPKTSATR